MDDVIGQIRKIHGDYYVCKEFPKDVQCRNCDLFGKCYENYTKIVTCSGNLRKDKKNIVYKKVNVKPFDPDCASCKVQTVDGRSVRIICRNAAFETYSTYCIVALVKRLNSNTEEIIRYDKYGISLTSNGNDNLMMVVDKKSVWVNIYKDGCYSSELTAKASILDRGNYIKTIEIQIEDE